MECTPREARHERHVHERHTMIIELLVDYSGQYMMLELCSESAVSKFGGVALF